MGHSLEASRESRPETGLQTRQCGAWPCYPNPQAINKSEPEHAPKSEMAKPPTEIRSWEGRCPATTKQPQVAGGAGVVGMSMWGKSSAGTGEASQETWGSTWETVRYKVLSRNPGRSCEESAELIVPMKRGNARGGKGLYFG